MVITEAKSDIILKTIFLVKLFRKGVATLTRNIYAVLAQIGP